MTRISHAKKPNILSSVFIMLLLVSFSYTSNLAKMKKVKTNKTATQSKLLTQEEAELYEANGMEVMSIDIAKTCVSSLMDAMPPAFCWKSGGDVGRIPTGCPAGYFRFLAMCYENCRPGYHFILGVCYKDCDPGYDNHPLSCYKNLFSWYFKSSYISHILTNFSDKVPCPGNMYRFGALCYRDCELVGMFNCGIGACVAEKSTCLVQIGDMVLKVLEGIGTAVSTVMSFGATAAAKTAAKAGLKAAVKSAGKAGINMAKKTLKSVFTGQFKKQILQKAKNKIKTLVKDELKDFVKGAVTEAAKQTAIQSICTEVWNKAIEKTSTTEVSDVTDSFADNLVGSLDVLGVGSMVKSCGDVSADGGLGCAKSVVEGLSTFDPTGMMTIAAAFMHPSCDVPEVGEKNEEDPLETKELDPAEVERIMKSRIAEREAHQKRLEEENRKFTEVLSEEKIIEGVKKDCVRVSREVNFRGLSVEVCQTVPLFGRLNDDLNSFIVGTEAKGIFFEHADFKGKHIPFGSGLVVKDVNNFKNGDVTLKDMISSLYLGDGIMVILSFEDSVNNLFFEDPRNYIEYPRLLRNGAIKDNRNFTKEEKATAISIQMYFSKKTVEIEFEDGTKKTVTDSTTFSIDDIPNVKGKSLKGIKLL